MNPPIIRIFIVEDDQRRVDWFRAWLPKDMRLVHARSGGRELGVIQRDRTAFSGIMLDHDLQQQAISASDSKLAECPGHDPFNESGEGDNNGHSSGEKRLLGHPYKNGGDELDRVSGVVVKWRYQDYQPIAFKIANGETRKIDVVSVSSYFVAPDHSEIFVKYQDGMLLIDGNETSWDRAARLLYDQSWRHGGSTTINTKSRLDLRNVKVGVKVIPHLKLIPGRGSA